jgi:hypothetical protein
MSPELLAVAVCFLLSLGGAWVLFKWLSSTAGITRKDYQVGGAAAGCLLLFSALYGAYYYLEAMQLKATEEQLATCNAQLKTSETQEQIMGTVSPVPKGNATVVLATMSTNLADDGRFVLATKGLDFAKVLPALYVVGQTQHWYKQSFLGDDLHNLKIDLQSER